MDPSSWVNYTAAQHYSRLRGNHHQMNVHPNVPGLNVATQSSQLNMNDHLSSINSNHQAMTGHYSGSAAAHHSWLFPHVNSLNAASHQATNHHPDHASSFNPSPFLHHPSYDASSFLSGPFPSAKAAGYIQTAGGFFNPMKKEMSGEMSNLRGPTFPAHCTPMNIPGMGPGVGPPNINNMSTDPNSNLATGNIFSSHLGPTSWRHHPNLMSANASSGPFGILPHESVNVMNTGASSSHAHGASHHTGSSHNNKTSDNLKHHHHHHKQSAVSSAMANATDNSLRSMIPSLQSQSGHPVASRNQTFDPTANPKLTHHHGQTDHYNLAAAAAAAAVMNHAMTTEYSMQQSRYGMTSGNHQHAAFTGNSASRNSYGPVGFGNESTARNRDLLSSSNFLHASKTSSSGSCSARTMNVMNATNYLNCGMMMMNTNSSSNNYSPSPAHNVSVNNSVSNNIQAAVNSNTSRSSSAASNHQLQGNDSSSCSFGYGSPATNLPQSPYQQPQRSNTSTSSQGTPTASSGVQQTGQDFSSYANQQVYPSMGTPAPTPTPGYPTPPSSVGQAHQTPQTNSHSSSSHSSASSHDDSVSHYPQLTPQTPSSQSNPFGSNYNTTYPTTPKLQSNSSRTTEPIISNTSSCMVAAAAASMNNAAVSQRTSSGYMMSGSEPESCLSNMVNVNAINNNLSDSKMNTSQMTPSAEVSVLGHQNEPTLNSVFASHDIDFPSISFPTNDDGANSFGANVKIENSYHKKKAKREKKLKKKDKNKQSVSMSMDSTGAYQNYYQQYPNSYSALPTSDAYLMQQQSIQHTQQQTHNMMTASSGTETNAAGPCFDLQYQHIPQTDPQQHDTSLQALTHEAMQSVQQQQQTQQPQQQQAQQSQSQHQLIEPVIAMSNSQQVEPSQAITDKQSFPTIDDELSFLTEPTECVAIETQNTSIQVETQTPAITTSTVSINESTSINGKTSQQETSQTTADGLLNSLMTFINDTPRTAAEETQTKEKRKRKHKENAVFLDDLNGVYNGQQKSSKKSKTSDKCEENSQKKKEMNKTNSLGQNQAKNNFVENTTLKKTGDSKDYESKFFKRRPSSYASISLPTNDLEKNKDTNRSSKKRKQKENKNDMHLFDSKQTAHDEYEFPDSPLSSSRSATKKKKKSSSSETCHKKQTTFEKMSAISSNASTKKPNLNSNANKKSQLSTNNKDNIKLLNEANKFESKNEVSLTKNLPTASVAKQSPPKQLQQPQVKANFSKQTHQQSRQHQTESQSPTKSVQKPQQNAQSKKSQSQNLKKNLNAKQTSVTTSVTNSTSSSDNSSVTNTGVSNASVQSVGMQSAGTNTPRRRSQDKKASTIREGLMRTGDFVIAIEEINYDLPVIWRIEGKSLLQRFEPSDQDGTTVYINTSSYSAWNPTVRQRYTGVDVRVMGCSRTRIVVEKLGLTQNNPNNLNGSTTIERVSGYNKSSTTSTSLALQENFEVFIQTLVSQALDPNFISEIVKENDEYFVNHVQAIDDVCSRKKSRFFSKIKWDANIVKCVETYPVFSVTPQNNIGDLRCRLCHDNWSTQLLQFSGDPYNPTTLEVLSAVDMKQTKYAACDSCKDKIILYSNLHHQKYNFFQKCRTKVENVRGGDENKESHDILEECLKDTGWISSLFKQLEEIWNSCDKIR